MDKPYNDVMDLLDDFLLEVDQTSVKEWAIACAMHFVQTEVIARGKVRMRGIVKTGLMVGVAVATTNRRFAIAWDRLRDPFTKVSKRKLVKRKRYHHALTSITHTVNGQLVVLHPLTT